MKRQGLLEKLSGKDKHLAKIKLNLWRFNEIRADIENIEAPEEIKLQVLGRLDDFIRTVESFIAQLEKRR